MKRFAIGASVAALVALVAEMPNLHLKDKDLPALTAFINSGRRTTSR